MLELQTEQTLFDADIPAWLAEPWNRNDAHGPVIEAALRGRE